MTIEEQVHHAKSPQEALLVIARALDVLIINVQVPPAEPPNPWGGWDNVEQAVSHAAEVRGVSITGDTDHTDVVIPAPSLEKIQKRRLFETQELKLHEHLPTDQDSDWTEAYAKGGPLWLYLGNRDVVMSFPDSIRRAMVADVEEDSPQDAAEMGRDVLKEACETGPGGLGMFVAEGEIG